MLKKNKKSVLIFIVFIFLLTFLIPVNRKEVEEIIPADSYVYLDYYNIYGMRIIRKLIDVSWV